MYKGKIDKLINEINKIARLKRISYKLENIYEEYDEFIEDYYFMEWLRMSQDGITQIEELNNMLELFEQILEELKIKHSYSKKGYPYDNASMESFNAILKKEEVNVNNYETFNEAKLAIFEFIESWYNNQRIHSTIGYITPNEKYNNYIASLALA